MKKLITLFLCVVFAFITSVPAKASNTLTVEQVQLSPPDMNFYVYSDEDDLSRITKDDVSATAGKYTFDIDSVEARDSGTNGIFYAFLLDISGSIPQSSLDAAIRSIGTIADSMTDSDKLAVITFGDRVKVISDGSKAPKDTLEALKGLRAKDQTTEFYSAMDKLISVSGKANGMRTVAVVVSDGVDDTDAGMTEKELTTTLKNSGIAVYAMQVGKVTKEQTSHLRKFISVSGGEVYRFNEKNAADTVKSLVGRIDDVVTIHLLGDKDMDFDDGAEVTLMIKGYAPIRWKIDGTSWKEAEKLNPGQGKPSEDSASVSSSSQESTKKIEEVREAELKRQRQIIIISIAAVIIAAVVIVLILMAMRSRNIKRSFYEENGIDEKSAEDIDRAIRKKRRRH